MNAVANFMSWMDEVNVPDKIVEDLLNEASKIDALRAAEALRDYHEGYVNSVDLCNELCSQINNQPSANANNFSWAE